MVDFRKLLVVLVTQILWQELEAAVAYRLARQVRTGTQAEDIDLFCPAVASVGVGYVSAGRLWQPMRRMISLLYLKRTFLKRRRRIRTLKRCV